MPTSRTRKALAGQARRDSRSMHPYDGVLGLPPTWMPSPLTLEFVSVRDELLDAHPIDVVRRWFNGYRVMMEPVTQARSVHRVPSEQMHSLETLAYVFSLAELGEERGILAYLGRGADTVLRRRAVDAANRAKQQAGNRQSAVVRQKKRLARDVRIRAAADMGVPLKRVAQKELVSLATISRALKRSRR